jgi:hypothetical protein
MEGNSWADRQRWGKDGEVVIFIGLHGHRPTAPASRCFPGFFSWISRTCRACWPRWSSSCNRRHEVADQLLPIVYLRSGLKRITGHIPHHVRFIEEKKRALQ